MRDWKGGGGGAMVGKQKKNKKRRKGRQGETVLPQGSQQPSF